MLFRSTFATGIMGLVCFIKCIIMLGNKDLKPVVTQASVANFDTETGERINNFDPMTGEKIVQHPVQPQEQITNNVQLQEQVTNDVQLQEQVTNDVQLQEQAITQTNSVVGGETTETSVQSSAILPEPIENKENVNSSIPKDLYGDKSVIGNTSTGSITKYNAGESSIHVCKNCTNCGTKLYIKKGFCPDCGTPIPEEKETNQ